jgi:hypothetical protein
MKIPLSFLIVVLVLTAVSFAQAPSVSPDQGLEQVAPGTLIPAELSKSLDAKKAKPGDKIEAKTTMDMLSHGQIVIPRNTKIEGHVTSAKPHTKESPDSALGIAFDRILMKNGRELPIQAAIQAIAPPFFTNSDAPGTPGAIGSSAPPGQESGNVGSAESPSTALSSSGQIPSMAAPGKGTPTSPSVSLLTSESHGAVGMKGITLSGSKEAAVISSNSQNIHLDSGMQLMLRTE